MAPTCAGWALLLLLVTPAAAIISQKALPEPKPDFAVCDTPQGCGDGSAPQWQIRELLARVAERAREVAAAGRTPLILHIGASQFGNTARWSDLHLYREVISGLPQLPGSFRLVLVEPLEYKVPQIHKNLAKLDARGADAQIVTAAVDKGCAADAVTFYTVSPRAHADLNVTMDVVGGWASLSRDRLVGAVRGAIHAFCTEPCTELCQSRCPWVRALNGSIEDYIAAQRVPCLTPSRLLAEVGANASDLAMLNVDAEGADIAIVRSFLGQPGFRPGFLQWEALWSKAPQIVPAVHEAGFLVGRFYADQASGSDSDNMFAVPAHS